MIGSRWASVAIAVGMVGIAGCDISSMMGKGDGSSKPAAATAPAAPAAPGAPAPAAPAGALEMPDWNTLFGTKADGWNPKVFNGLKEDMTPAQAEAFVPGAGKPSEFGFADIPVTNVRGVSKYRLSFQAGKLKFAEIWFKKQNDGAAFQQALVAAGKAKWGEHTPTKPGEEMTMWIADDFKSVTVSKIIDLSETGWQVQVAVAK